MKLGLEIDNLTTIPVKLFTSLKEILGKNIKIYFPDDENDNQDEKIESKNENNESDNENEEISSIKSFVGENFYVVIDFLFTTEKIVKNTHLLKFYISLHSVDSHQLFYKNCHTVKAYYNDEISDKIISEYGLDREMTLEVGVDIQIIIEDIIKAIKESIKVYIYNKNFIVKEMEKINSNFSKQMKDFVEIKNYNDILFNIE